MSEDFFGVIPDSVPAYGTDQIAGAFAKAQASFEPIIKDRLVEVKTDKGKYDFRYATLSEIIKKTFPALNANEIAVHQQVRGTCTKRLPRTRESRPAPVRVQNS